LTSFVSLGDDDATNDSSDDDDDDGGTENKTNDESNLGAFSRYALSEAVLAAELHDGRVGELGIDDVDILRVIEVQGLVGVVFGQVEGGDRSEEGSLDLVSVVRGGGVDVEVSHTELHVLALVVGEGRVIGGVIGGLIQLECEEEFGGIVGVAEVVVADVEHEIAGGKTFAVEGAGGRSALEIRLVRDREILVARGRVGVGGGVGGGEVHSVVDLGADLPVVRLEFRVVNGKQFGSVEGFKHVHKGEVVFDIGIGVVVPHDLRLVGGGGELADDRDLGSCQGDRGGGGEDASGEEEEEGDEAED